MKKNIKLIISAVFVFFVAFLFVKSIYLNKLNTNDWIIIPNERIGSLNRASIHKQEILKDIKKAFGSENVKETEFSIGEGSSLSGFSIYPNTENEINVHFDETSILFKFPGYNSYFSSNDILSSKTKWQIYNGVKIGSSISEIQKINGKTFELSGFEWDYPGVVSTWLGGKLPNELSIAFKQTASETPIGYDQIVGDKIITSDNTVLQKTDPVVNFVYIKWDFN